MKGLPNSLILRLMGLEMGYLYLYRNIPESGGWEAQSCLPKPTCPLMGCCAARLAGILLVMRISDVTRLGHLRLPGWLATPGKGQDDESPRSAADWSALQGGREAPDRLHPRLV